MSASPPPMAGADQLTMRPPLRESTEVMSGALGGWATRGTVGLEAGDAALVPAALVAVMVIA